MLERWGNLTDQYTRENTGGVLLKLLRRNESISKDKNFKGLAIKSLLTNFKLCVITADLWYRYLVIKKATVPGAGLNNSFSVHSSALHKLIEVQNSSLQTRNSCILQQSTSQAIVRTLVHIINYTCINKYLY